MKNLLLAAAMVGALSLPASAAEITIGGQVWTIGGTALTLGGVPSGNQVDNNPCIICGANQPNQTNFAQNFGYTDFGNRGSLSDIIFFSSGILRDGDLAADTISGTNYTGTQIGNLLTAMGGDGYTFSIGIDVNDTNKAQILESFFFLDLTSHTVLASFSPELGGVPLPSLSNGTGFPDYQLNGLTLAGLDLTHEYAFFGRISGANDGPDSFFIVAQAVPGPIVGAGLPGLITACFALMGLAGWRRRRNAMA